MPRPSLARACCAELVGTFLLVFFGTGAVWVGVVTGAMSGLFQVAIVWGLAIGLAIYATGAISGAHLNPAVTVALCVWRRFPATRVGPYAAAQLAGGFLAAAVLFGLFSGTLRSFESAKGLVRGQPGSELSAMVFGEYFPNPAIVGTSPAAFAQVSEVQAILAEGFGTALLVFVIFALTDERNRGRPHPGIAAPLVGLTVTALICVIAPLTQAGFNPARDLGPRLMAWLCGWGSTAIPGPRGGFLSVYILSPVLGGLAGGGLHGLLLGRAYGPIRSR